MEMTTKANKYGGNKDYQDSMGEDNGRMLAVIRKLYDGNKNE